MKILEKLSEIVYVKVIENGFLVTINSSNKEVRFESSIPFTTQRLAIGEFAPAESLLKKIITKTKRSLFQAAPIVVMHQTIKNENGLSEVENRVLREIGLGAGAINVYIWQGHNLTSDDIKNEVYKSI